MDSIVYIIGPTGVGKTGLASYLAQKLEGHLMSADSIQVYKGLDIISGKDLDNNSHFNSLVQKGKCMIGTHRIDGIETWCLDVVDPTYSYNVSDFYDCAQIAISEIRKQGSIPIVVGGTTLYVKSLLEPIPTLHVRPDSDLRRRLENKSLDELRTELKKISPVEFSQLNASEIGNKRRIIRKIELKKRKETLFVEKNKIQQEPIVIGLFLDRNLLKSKIDQRVEQRISNGAFEEAEGLYSLYNKLAPQVQNANGYRQLFSYFEKKFTKEEAIQRWKYSEYRHAKNQMTYFKKYITAEWFDVENADYKQKIINLVSNTHVL